MLEERLIQYQGTMLLVSHDREFLNNVVTSCIVFESDNVREYVGGYDDWLRQSNTPREQPAETKPKPTENKPAETPAKKEPQAKLSFKENRELEQLPSTIESLEASIATLHEKMASPDFYKKPKEEIAREQASLRDLETKLATAYSRWAELDSRK